MLRLALLFVLCMLWVEIYCHGDESAHGKHSVHHYGRFGHPERRGFYNLNSGPGELHRSRHPPFAWHRHGNPDPRLTDDVAGVREARAQRMFHKESPVGGPNYNRDEQPMFDDRQEELDKSDLMSAADASFRSFLTEQLTRKQNNGLTKKVVISRRDKNALFKPVTSNNAPDLGRPDQIKRGEQPTMRKGTMDRESSPRRSESGEESVMNEEKQKDDFLIQDTESRRKDSKKNIPNVEKWAEVEKPEGASLNPRPRTRHDGRLRTKTASLKPLLDGILKEDRKSDPHPLYLKHRSHPMARESLEKPMETVPFDPQLKNKQLNGFHEQHASDGTKRQSALHNSLKSDTVRRPKESAKGKLTDDEWMNFRLLVGDSGSLKIELVPPKKTQTNSDENAAPSLSSSFFSNGKHGLKNQQSSSDHEQDVHDDGPHRNSIWDSSSVRPAALQLTDNQFSEPRDVRRANDFQPGSASRKIADLLRRYSSGKHPESLARSSHNYETRLLMHPIDGDRPDASPEPSPSSRFVAATSSSTLPRTAIIDSVAIPLTVNVDDPIFSGCPVRHCATTCPGDLRKLTVTSGCPTCECCPTVKCDRTCKMGYIADEAGCPTCQCLQN